MYIIRLTDPTFLSISVPPRRDGFGPHHHFLVSSADIRDDRRVATAHDDGYWTVRLIVTSVLSPIWPITFFPYPFHRDETEAYRRFLISSADIRDDRGAAAAHDDGDWTARSIVTSVLSPRWPITSMAFRWSSDTTNKTGISASLWLDVFIHRASAGLGWRSWWPRQRTGDLMLMRDPGVDEEQVT